MENLLRAGLRKADEVEIYFETEEGTVLKSVLDRIESCDKSFSEGYAIRVIKNGRLGFGFFSAPSGFDFALRSALHMAKFAKKLDVHFPEKQRFEEVRGLFNKELGEKSEQELSDALLEMIEIKSKAHSVQNFIIRNAIKCSLLNSSGGASEVKETGIEISAIAQYKEARAFDYKTARSFFSGREVAENALNLAENLARAKPVRGEFEIILHPKAVSSFLAMIFAPAVNGERVFRNESNFAGKLNTQIASNITIYDDPRIPGGSSSCFCDDEGAKTHTRKIVENGVLKNFIYDLEHGRFCGKETTGNGFRASFLTPPAAVLSNIRVDSAERREIEDVKGVVVLDLVAMHNANPITGDFALEIGEGYLWNGEPGRAVRACSIIGNFFELLKKIELGDDDKNYGNYYGPSFVYRGKIV